jgi:uncharacterized 2Fe-2S/4Fe-4S cluster protein (DUF4445 family)
MKYTIEVLPYSKTITVEEDSILADCLQEADIDIRFDCNRSGLCGKCAVKIIEGNVPSPTNTERNLLSEDELSDRFRLSCLLRVKGHLKIEVPESSRIHDQLILKTGLQIPVQVNPPMKKFLLRLPKPTIAEPLSASDLIQKTLKSSPLAISPNVLKSLAEIMGKDSPIFSAVVYKDKELISIEEGNTLDSCFGFVVDLGTTTLVVELIDLKTGKTLDTLAGENTQSEFGADVVSRISFSLAKAENLRTLQKTIVDKFNRMFKEILTRRKIAASSVYEIALAGNTTMNHILLGLPLRSLAQAPFNSLFSVIDELPARAVGFKIHPNGKLYLAPNIQSFVGGDISAGLLASGLIDTKGKFMFIDLGTNGEIVLKTGETIVATSTAAGPAFEGMSISCGMLALPGAISKIEKGEKPKISTLLDQPAKGICGTGLIDAIALFLDEGLISAQGKIANAKKSVPITGRIFLSQKDIREIQLAVAAIKTGRNMLLKRFSIDPLELDGLFIAGAFGNYLNVKNAIRIGLLPPLPGEKIHFIGNSSLAGAKALLISAPMHEEIKSLIQKIRFISLASDPEFQDYFVESLEFPP